MRKLLTILSLLISTVAFGQSESHNFITYDTTIFYSGTTQYYFTLRISRPAAMFTPNSPDTASRPAIITMPGLGEVGTDTNSLKTYGPHFWLLNGWDGSVVLGNGIHYPILITVLQAYSSTRGFYSEALLQYLLNTYHIKRNAVHVGGLSEGGWFWGNMIQYSATAGDDHAAGLVTSFVNLQGVPANNSFAPGPTFPTGYGHAAVKYHLKGFFVYGRTDVQDQNTSNPSLSGYNAVINMNDSVANSCFVTYEDDGDPAGSHCCWNDFYNPSYNDWLTGSIITTKPNFPNVQGNYQKPCNIFQWMLRQGDTTLVGGTLPIVSAGSNQNVQLPANTATLTGTNVAQGSNTAASSIWSFVSGPGTPTITNSNSLTTTVTGLVVAGTYTFQLQGFDNTGASSFSTVTITVLQEVSPTVSAGGPYVLTAPTSTQTASASASGNAGASVVSYQWTQTGGAASTLTNSTSLNATFSGLVAGTYTYTLKATDNNGNSTTSTAIVTVNSGPTTPTDTLTRFYTGEYSAFCTKNGNAFAIGAGYQYAGTGNAGTWGAAMTMAFTGGTKIATIGVGLHGGAAVDSNGNVYVWGDGSMGQSGNGTIYPVNTWITTPVQIMTDSLGNPFTGIKTVVGYFAGNVAQGYYAVKNDGSLWTWGLTICGMRGDGTYGDTTKRPVQIPIPGGRLVKQVVAGAMTIILCTDGTVWTCGGDGLTFENLGYAGTGTQWLTLTQVTFPAGAAAITQIAGGIAFNYALDQNNNLYGWGRSSSYLGGPTTGGSIGPGAGFPTPTLLSNIMAALPTSIKTIKTNSTATFVILVDSTLWGWGDYSCGSLGNGLAPNWLTYATPYAWNQGIGENLQQLPVRITGRHDFVGVSGASVFTYYSYAWTLSDSVYSWGRNKGAVLGNGITLCNSLQSDSLPNSLDVAAATKVNVFDVTGLTEVSSVGCSLIPNLNGSCHASGCTLPSLTTTANAGQPFTTTSTTIMLNGSGTTTTGTGYGYTNYFWTGTGGTFVDQTSVMPIVYGLTPGQSYTFTLTVTDNQGNTSTASVPVNVVLGINGLTSPVRVLVNQ